MPACAIASSRRRRRSSGSMTSLLRRVLEPVVPARGLRRNIARRNVPLDLFATALARIAPPSATRRAEGEPVAGLELQARRLAQFLLGAVAPDQDGFIHGAGISAGKPPRRV